MSTLTSPDARPGARSPSRFVLRLGRAVVVVVVLEAALGSVTSMALLTLLAAAALLTHTADPDGGGFRAHVAVP